MFKAILLGFVFLLSFSFTSCSQKGNNPPVKKGDTTAFKKEFEKLLVKYGFNKNGYSLNVTSNNQNGGQTAFIITNNYYGDTMADSVNVEFKIINENGKDVLYVYPKSGVWVTAYIITDSLKTINRTFFEPGYGSIIPLSFKWTYENLHWDLIGETLGLERSAQIPIKIYLADNDPEQFYLFGDLQNSNKTYFFFQNKIIWKPDFLPKIRQ